MCERVCVRCVHVYECAAAVLNWSSSKLCKHETWLMHTCSDSLIRATFFHSFVCHDSFIYAPWLMHTRAMTHLYTWNDSCPMTPSYLWHDAFIHVTWLNYPTSTHLYMWHDSFIHVTWFIHTCNMTQLPNMDPFIYVTWLLHTCDMTHWYTWHDSFIHVTWRIYTCDMTHSCMWHDSLIHVTRLIHTRDDLFIHVTWPVFTRAYIHMTWLTHTCDTTDSYTWRLIHTRDMTCFYTCIHTYDMTHSYLTAADNNEGMSESCHMWVQCAVRYEWVMLYDNNEEALNSSFKWDMAHAYTWHDSFIHMTWLIHTCGMPHSYVPPADNGEEGLLCDRIHWLMWHKTWTH